jgi:anti-sigma regulatory factor (Ser/Thr protein kinase)
VTTSEVRVALPPDARSAGLARRYVRAACDEAGQDALVDDALLLVTELVTNAVVHAGTALELCVSTGPGGVRVEVSDGRPGGLPLPTGSVDEGREGGRGLFLLDRLASTWGSTHTPAGKSLWFDLGPREGAAPPPSVGEPPAATALDLPDVAWLLALGDRAAELGTAQVVRETLHRLVEGLSASWAVLLGPAPRGMWQLAEQVGEVPDELTAERVRRSLPSGVRTTSLADDLVLVLGRTGDPSGAVVLGGAAGLGASRCALARLAADGLEVLLLEDRSRADLHRDRGSLALLAEASEMFAGALDVTLATTLLCQLVVPRFGVWAAVYGAAGRGAQLLAATHGDEQQGAELRVRLSSEQALTLAGELATTRPGQGPRLLQPAERPVGLTLPGSEVLAIPLSTRSRSLGVLLLARSEGAEPVSDDIPVLVDLSRRAALAVEGARLYEERSAVAQALQASLLPPVLPEVDGLVFGARYAAAGEGNEVGGDFYDVFPVGDGRWAVAIGDVCGKGPEAATITGLARNVLRLMVEEGRAPEQAFRRLNAAILDLGDRGRFLTAALALLEPRDGGARVLLATAGHPPPVVLGTSGAVRFVGTGGTLLGVTPDVEIEVQHFDLAVGEHLVLYTDGVTERRDGARWFGEATLRTALSQAAGRTPDQVAGHLELQVRGFGPSAASDDLAVLVVGAVALREPAGLRVRRAGRPVPSA